MTPCSCEPISSRRRTGYCKTPILQKLFKVPARAGCNHWAFEHVKDALEKPFETSRLVSGRPWDDGDLEICTGSAEADHKCLMKIKNAFSSSLSSENHERCALITGLLMFVSRRGWTRLPTQQMLAVEHEMIKTCRATRVSRS